MRQTLTNLRKETETTLKTFYALKQFRKFLSSPEDVNIINHNPDFWRIFEVSVRTNLFIGIRRLYERKNDTFNFQQAISNFIKNINEFSKESLRERKLAGSPDANEWIDSYISEACEATPEDIKRLAKGVRRNSKRMNGPYTKAASKIYAHAIHMDYAVISQITDQLSFDEIEVALESIWHCYNQIWQMYENGSKPNFEVEKYPYSQEVIDCLNKQLV